MAVLQRHQHRHQDSLTNGETTGIHAFPCFAQFFSHRTSMYVCMYMCVASKQAKNEKYVENIFMTMKVVRCSLLTVYLNRSLIYAWMVYSCRIIIHSRNSTRLTYNTTTSEKLHFIWLLSWFSVYKMRYLFIFPYCSPNISKENAKEWSKELRQTMQKWCVIKNIYSNFC